VEGQQFHSISNVKIESTKESREGGLLFFLNSRPHHLKLHLLFIFLHTHGSLLEPLESVHKIPMIIGMYGPSSHATFQVIPMLDLRGIGKSSFSH